jgi:uncharacterized membrane protein
LHFFKNNIIAGLFVIVPLAFTMWIVLFLFEKLTSWSLYLFIHVPFVGHYANQFPLNQAIRISSLVFIVIIVFIVGALTRITLGKKIIRLAEWSLLKVPMIRIVYSTTKNISDAMRNHKSGTFSKVVLFEYPRKGIYSIGFVTNNNNSNWEIEGKISGVKTMSVFVPTTPNPTSGYLLFLPVDQVVYLDMHVSEAMKLIISGGALTPCE